MRVLMIDEEAQEKCAQVMAYARQHIYHPGPEAPVPGDNPGFVCHLDTYRCCFTYTKSPQSGALYRHLSISIPSEKYPSPESAAAIAGLFGFTEAEQGMEARVKAGKWMMYVEEREPHCIILAEELSD